MDYLYLHIGFQQSVMPYPILDSSSLAIDCWITNTWHQIIPCYRFLYKLYVAFPHELPYPVIQWSLPQLTALHRAFLRCAKGYVHVDYAPYNSAFLRCPKVQRAYFYAATQGPFAPLWLS